MEQIWIVNDCHEHCAIPSFVKLKCEQRVGRMVLIPRKSHYVICCCCSSVLEGKKLTRDSIIGKAAFTIYNNLKIWTYTSKLYSTTIIVFCWIRLNSSFPLTVKSLLLSKLRVLYLVKCNTFLFLQTSQTRTGKMYVIPVKSVFPIQF